MVCFVFTFIYFQSIFWFPFWFPLVPIGYLECVISFPHLYAFPNFLLLISNFISSWLKEHTLYYFYFFYIYWYLFNGLLGIWSILKNVSCTLEKNTIVAKNWFYNIQVPFIMLISCLVVLFLKVGVEVSNSVSWVVYFSLHFCQFFFMYFDVLLLGTYVFIIVIAIWWIEPSNVIKYPSISSNIF